MSTLAGEIWMDQLPTPATFVSTSANLHNLCLFLTDTFWNENYDDVLSPSQLGSILPPVSLRYANDAQLYMQRTGTTKAK